MSTTANLAFVFPGQGSQKVGMLADFYQEGSVFKQTFDEAQAALGYDLWALIQSGTQDELNMTEVTQPALLACSVALWRKWQAEGGAQPAYMSGHSLGEWSALVCAGVVAFEDALRLVRSRGKYMQEAVPAGVGAMAAIIGLDDAAVEAACATAAEGGDIVSPVNYNSPGQLVIAGMKAGVEKAMELCKEAGAKRALPLPVSAPFHTALMKPAADKLAAEVEAVEFNTPQIPVVHNVTAKTEADANTIKALMIQQISAPVLWVDCVNELVALGVEKTVECGPGKVLSGLNKRIQKSLAVSATETTDLFAEALANA